MGSAGHRVRWTELAALDLEEIVGFIALDSPAEARRCLRRLERRASALRSMPLRGRVVPELAAVGVRAWRELVVPPHRLVYRVLGEEVHVMAVFDGRRDLEDVLLDRLLRAG